MTSGGLLATLLTAIIALMLLAKKLGVPYPVVFVAGGALLGFIPGTPAIVLQPDLVFLLFLPPLIFGDGWTTDVRTFVRFRRPILLLAIGLVLFTSACVAYAARALMAFPLALGFVLGAILSPTDAVATDAIAEEVGLPRRLGAIISGESLVNDASGLVIYAFAVTAVVSGAFSLGFALLQFAYVVIVGLAVGIGGGAIAVAVTERIRKSGLSDQLIMVSISLLTPFALYVPADALHASGVLAALSGGMMLSRKSSRIFDAQSRIAASAVWNLLFFMFNGAAFVLIGLQLRSIVSALNDVYSAAQLAIWSLGIASVVIVARYAWVFTTSYVRFAFFPADMREGPPPSWRHVFVLGTAGMRGVVSLAAALALPVAIPHRDLILFIVFVVIVVTLAGQGLLIPVLIRRWNLVETDDALAREVALARVTMAEAVTVRMRELEPQITAPEEWEVLGRIIAECEQRVTHYRAHVDGSAETDLDATQHEIEARLRREAFGAQRRALHQLRGAGTITDEAYRQVEWQVDLAESRLE